MTDKQLQDLLALKKCESPSQDRLGEVETLFRYNLRLQRIQEKTSTPRDIFRLPSWLVRWSPVAACIAIVAFGAAHISSTADQIQQQKVSAATTDIAPGVMSPAPNRSLLDFFPVPADDTPLAQPARNNSFAIEATPVVFDESRITY